MMSQGLDSFGLYAAKRACAKVAGHLHAPLHGQEAINRPKGHVFLFSAQPRNGLVNGNR